MVVRQVNDVTLDAMDSVVLRQGPSGRAGRVFREALGRVREQGYVSLARVEGVGFEVWARWFYRRWLEEEGRGGPFLSLDARSGGAALAEVQAWEVMRGGMVALEAEVGAEVVEAARAAEVAVVQAGEDVVRADEAFVVELLRFDASHDVAVDEGFRELRRGMLAACMSCGPVHLRGEGATGKRALAVWAHRMLDDQELIEVRGSQGLGEAGRWVLYDEVGSLGREQRESLSRALDERMRPPGVVRAGPVGRRPAGRGFDEILGESQALCEVLAEVARLGPSRLSVLVTGEPGVGKELLARAIHRVSGRGGPFVALDMGALSADVAESELFGHVRGAFTGAVGERFGAFRAAEGGTLFLDEVGNLTPALQVKLLRVLQEGEVLPVGADRPVRVDTRVVAATNADLRLMVMQGRFRADLLGRLNAATVRLPALRERIGDLEVLARGILEREGYRVGEQMWDPQVGEVLREYHWPGNVRELGHVLRYAAAMREEEGAPIGVEHLGRLSPRRRREAPLLTTQSGDEALGVVEGARGRLMTMTTLRVPALRERSVGSRRQAVLSALGGRLVDRAGLEMLVRAPWYGNQLELVQRLKALRAAPAGVIGVEEVHRYLPDVVGGGSQAPVRVLMQPVRVPQGGLGGWSYEVDAGALIIGRMRGMEELYARSAEARVKRTLEVVKAQCGGVRPVCVDLGFMERLSRAHLLVTRSGQGLKVTLLPGTSLRAYAGAVGEAMEELVAGEAVEVGEAGEIELRRGSGERYMQLFMVMGEVSAERYAEAILLRSRRDTRSTAGMTMGTMSAGMSPALTSGESSATVRVWELSEVEVEALTDLVAGYEGGQFNRHVLAALRELRGRASCQQLVQYLEGAARKAQYVVRLYEKEENEALRQRLRERFERLSDREVRVASLPAGLRRVLEA